MPVEKITADEVKVRMDRGEPVAFADARDGLAWAESDFKLPRAVRLPPDDIDPHVDDLPHDRMVVVYCSSPEERTSTRVAYELKDRGFRHVRVLAGGYDQWRLAGYPLDKRAMRAGTRY